MYRKYYLVEVVILLLLSHGGWNGPSVTLLSCTSESSKLVRDVIQKRFLPVVERYRVSLPLECPLHPRRDMFWWLQTELEATKSAGEDTWNCPVCGKKFRCENTFVTHWDASHSRSMGITDETVCLDDFCDVFRCDILRKNMQKQRREEEEELQKAVADRSFQLTTFSFRYKPELSEEEEEEIRRNKRKCDRKAMSRLHKKCRSLIRSCTIGMLANLSSKDFQDIEDDLDQAICSFLTCDRYWDDFDAGIHHVPVLVLAIFSLIIISLFSFCYYGTWVLMEKSPIGANQLCCNCQKSQSVEYRAHRPRAHRYKYRQISPDLRKNSPDFKRNPQDFRQNSPDIRQNSPESRDRVLDFRQNSPENRERILDLRQNSPENRERILDLRKNSPENRERILDFRQNSPDFRHNSPGYRHNSPDFRHNSPDFRHNSPDFRDISPEYRQNSPEYRQSSPDYRDNSPEYRGNSPDYRDNSPESRKNSPDYRDNSPELGRNQPEFRYNSPDFRLNSPNFRHNSPNLRHNSPDCQQNSPDFIATKRAPSRCAR